MRMEYEGTVQVQPPYQHVGYTAAAVMGSERSTVNANGAVLAALGIALLLTLYRCWRVPRFRKTALVGGIVVLVVAPWTFLQLPGDVVLSYHLVPQFAATLLTLEQLVAQTDRAAADLRRVPTPEEWTAQFCEVKDAWGNGFVYRSRHAYQMMDDGRGYEILSTNGHGPPHRDDPDRDYGWMVLSVWLGPDGVAGTSDDYHRLTEELGRCRVRDRAQLEKIAGRAIAPEAAEGS
jgi:hypothetical protein